MDLNVLDRLVSKLNGQLLLRNLDPLNLKGERRKVFRNSDYDPQFKYRKSPLDRKIVNKLSKVKVKKSVMGKVLDRKRKEVLEEAKMFENLGEGGFTVHSVNIYGKPNKTLLKKARRLIRLKKEKVEEKLTKKKVIGELSKALKRYKFKWRIIERNMVADMMMNISGKTIYINKSGSFHKSSVRRLVAHEIGGHVLRAENGSEQPYRIFIFGFPGYLSTEEGLALHNEQVAGALRNNFLRIYAGRVIAVYLGLEGSFSYIYKELLKHFSKQEAFTLTARSKRGLTDTSQKGGFTKDQVYLKGKIEVERFLARGGDVKKLYVGKIGVNDVSIVDKMKNIKPAKYLPLI